ncbi:MAG: hypothetical protein J6U23_02480 [Clostridiales bacterium]|nr:hypothetical protein [Clostridiales bacterium]
MEFLYGLLFQYAIGITVGFIIAMVSRKNYQRQNEELKQQINNINQYSAPVNQVQMPMVQQPVQPMPQAQVQQPAPQVQPSQMVMQQSPNPSYVQAAAPAPQKAVAPSPAPASRPAPSNEPQKTKISAVGIAFAVGVLLLIVSAAVFLTASWQTLAPITKCAVLGAVTLVVFGMSAVFKKVLKLEKTSSAFYSLGCLLVPVTLLAGYWSFDFSEVFILLILCALSLAVTGFIGYKIFNSKLHCAISYLGLIWVVVFICGQIIGDINGFIFGMALACLVAGIVGFFVKNKLISTISEVISYVAVLVFFLAFATQLPWQMLAMVASAVAFTLCFKKRKFILNIAPVLLVIMAITALFHFYSIIEIEDRYLAICGLIICLVFAVAYLVAMKLLKLSSPFTNAYLLAGTLTAAIFTAVMVDCLNELVIIPSLIACLGIIILSKINIEKMVYWPILAIITIIEVMVLPNAWPQGLIALGIFAAVYVYSLFSKNWIATISFTICAIFVYCANTAFYEGYFFLGVPVALYVATIVFEKKKPFGVLEYAIFRGSLSVILAVTSFDMIDSLYKHPDALIAVIIAASVLFLIVSIFDPKDKFAGAVPSLIIPVSFCWLYFNITEDYLIDKPFAYALYIAFILIFAAAGRLIYRSLFSRKHVDFLMIFTLAFVVMGYMARLNIFVLLSVFFICLIGGFGTEGQTIKEKIMTYIKPILSLVTLSVALAFINTDIDVIDKSVLYQLRLLAFAIAAFIICFVIKLKGRKWLWFTSIVIVLQIDLIIALVTKDLIPLSVVFAIAIAVSIYSFIGKRKAYLLLGVVSFIESVVGLSTVYWQNRFWWIYLLIAGVALIGMASANEYKRRKAIEAGEENKKIMLFENWSW